MDLLVTDQEAGPDQVVAVMARDLVVTVAKLSPL